MKLVIVESPTKAKTISKFLGRNFVVKSSFGHIRDLPKSKLGIDTTHDFAPQYVVPTKSRKTVTDLRKSAAKAKTIIFATDEDREGEAISWHLSEIFSKELGDDFAQKKLERIAFHEITEEAVREALDHPRTIDFRLVNAQQARRILDRLVGYELSPLLWQKIARGLSAGRVQSVALRLIVEREREIQAFKPEEYWTIEAVFQKEKDSSLSFEAKLAKIDDHVLDKFAIKTEAEAKVILDALKEASFIVETVTVKTNRRSPSPPFTTSTLQQEANRKLGFSAKQTMVIAQQLYEGVEIGERGSVGLITYMRTDAVNLSERFLEEARQFIQKQFGAPYLPAEGRRYKTKSRLAQEAHEAIRPTAADRRPETLKPFLDPSQHKLYELIWRRAVSSQMNDAEIESTGVDIRGAERYLFRATGSRLAFPGFLALSPGEERNDLLPPLAEGEGVTEKSILPKQHFTEPPARYSDASLVKALEEYGIGRPSTYAPTIATLLERNYAERIEGRRFKPTEIAFMVNDFLMEHFPNILDYHFTARMEEDLDDIAEGSKEWVPVVRAFYDPFSQTLAQKKETLVKESQKEMITDERCDRCGKPMAVKFSRFGKFLACTGFPECKGTKSLKSSGRESSSISTGTTCPKCGKGEIVSRRSKRGKIFWSCNTYPACDFALWKKPTGATCLICKSLMVEGTKGKIYCSNPECSSKQKTS